LTNFSFLGMIWGSTEGTSGRPWVRLERLRGQALLLLSCPLPSHRQVMVLTGLVAAFFNAVPLLRLKGRFIQVSLTSVYVSKGFSEEGDAPLRGKARSPLDVSAPAASMPWSPPQQEV
jgi:hypothetical protein